MKDLHTYAPADLIRFMEHLTGKPATLSAYKDRSLATPFNMVKAVMMGGHLVMDVRSPKHKMTLEVSPGLMVANPALVDFLRAGGFPSDFAAKVRLCDDLGAFRCFSVAPRRAEALRELLGALKAPVAHCLGESDPALDGVMERLESITGRQLGIVTVADWGITATPTMAEIVSLGPLCPSFAWSGGELFASTAYGLLDCPLSYWIIEGGTTFQKRGENLIVVNRLFVRGDGWASFRRIAPEQLGAVYQMVAELIKYQVTHHAPTALQ